MLHHVAPDGLPCCSRPKPGGTLADTAAAQARRHWRVSNHQRAKRSEEKILSYLMDHNQLQNKEEVAKTVDRNETLG
jgi:hypothetical protein